jgi:hypothetical protein
MGNDANVSQMYAVSVFRIEISRVTGFLCILVCMSIFRRTKERWGGWYSVLVNRGKARKGPFKSHRVQQHIIGNVCSVTITHPNADQVEFCLIFYVVY